MELLYANQAVFAGRRRAKLLWLFGLLGVLVATVIKPLYPGEMLLQHSATVLVLGYIVRDLWLDRRSMLAMTGLYLFLVLHIVGARHIYSFVPYNEWSIKLFSFDLQQHMGWARNHFDRFVHFMFGLLLLPLFSETLGNHYAKSAAGAVFFGWMAIQCGSLLYEVFEWWLATVMTEQGAEYYNGQQGDFWDAQKDMALALLGSTVAAVGLRLRPPARSG